ncbi:MAG: cupredoxin domain-containing protein [Nitrospiraceae bacterium]
MTYGYGRMAAVTLGLVAAALVGTAALPSVQAQTEQVVDVTIRDNAFRVTKQVPLLPNVPIRIHIVNEDSIRHDFGSTIFHGTPTQVEHAGVSTYGQDIGGVYLDGGKTAKIQFTLHKPGNFEFKCSIHPNMKGEILLMSVSTV